jgi:hypothetical protein
MAAFSLPASYFKPGLFARYIIAFRMDRAERLFPVVIATSSIEVLRRPVETAQGVPLRSAWDGGEWSCQTDGPCLGSGGCGRVSGRAERPPLGEGGGAVELASLLAGRVEVVVDEKWTEANV